MNFTTIITAWTPWQAVGLVCIVYCADYLHVMGATYRRSRGYDHSTHGQHQAPAAAGAAGASRGWVQRRFIRSQRNTATS
jgi:hypothetical protein